MSYYTYREGFVCKALCGFCCAVFVTAVLVKPTRSEVPSDSSLSSNYLIARQAEKQYDYDVAIRSYRNVYEYDQSNLDLLQRTLLFETMNGEIESAVQLARRMIHSKPNHYLSRLILVIRATRAREYSTARRHLSSMDKKDTLIALSVNFLTAWIYQGSGDIDRALSILSVPETNPLYSYYAYHAALIADLSGRQNEAAIWFEKTRFVDNRLLHILDAYGRFLIRQNNSEQTSNFLLEFDRIMPFNPLIANWRNDIAVGKIPTSVVNNTRMGIAEALYTLGIMINPTSKELAAIYLRLSLYLNPDASFPLIELAGIYNDWKQYSLAATLYAQVSEESPLKSSVEIKRALNYVSLQNIDRSIAILRDIIRKYPDNVQAAVMLGEIYMDKELFEQAVSIYSPMIDGISRSHPRYWQLLYLRGVSYERSGKWNKAEIDLKQAHKMFPNQPLILNYLGYSWVERGIHLDAAMKLLETAVMIVPKDGNIVDSLGWCHYKLKNYDDAVRELERAIELKPEHALINDHLGDAYWHVGRYLEARYQWGYALKLKPRAKHAEMLKIKLSKGLVNERTVGKH